MRVQVVGQSAVRGRGLRRALQRGLVIHILDVVVDLHSAKPVSPMAADVSEQACISTALARGRAQAALARDLKNKVCTKADGRQMQHDSITI